VSNIPLTALMLEDRQADADLIEAALRRAGLEFRLTRVETEVAYLAALPARPDFVIADYRLPQFDALRALGHLAEQGLDIPFIVVSDAIGDEEAAALIKAGAADYLLKDRLGRLGPAVRAALATRALRAQQRQDEAALRESDERTRLIVDNALDAVITIDDSGRILSWNPPAERIFGWRAGEVLGRPLSETIVPHQHRAAHDRGLEHFRATGEGPVLGRQLELTALRRDGTEFPVELAITPVRLRGSVVFSAFVRDITERAKAEEARRESEASFRLLFASNPLPMWVYDAATLYFLEVNRAAVAQYGYSREEFLRMRIRDIRPPEEILRLEAAVAELASGPEDSVRRHTGSWRHRLKDGRIREVDIASHSISFGGRRAALVVAHDVTDLREAERGLARYTEELEHRVGERTRALSQANARLEQEIAERRRAEAAAEQANHAKSEFLSRMSHELRTPLNAILGFAQLLEMDQLSPDQESLGQILRAGRHLLGLINEVLDISRIETGQLHVSLEPVAVEDILRAAIDLVRPLADARGIALAADVAGDSRHVLADRQRLQQVLLNLLSNGVKYNAPGGRVHLSCVAAPDDRLRIRVADTGPGLAPDKLARLFTPFDRLGAESSAEEGTGLGLTLSKRLVEVMGGALHVDSRVGEGSVFSVELPLVPAPTALPDAGAREQARAERGDRPPVLVLYVEDNLSNLRLVERIAERRPHVKILPAMQGRVGIDLARQHRPDLILLDRHLPDMGGDEVLRLLREDPRTTSIPVVILSADASPSRVQALLGQGARDYLTKPLDVHRLLELLDTLSPGPPR
jgi:PAS domain S-box-containing protein